MLNILLIIDVLIAIGLTALILLQRGPGATAGAAFGSGASGTVFGARGSANFLTRATAGLAAAFFLVTLVMAVVASRQVGLAQNDNLGVMSALPAASEATITLPGGDGEVPTMTMELTPNAGADGAGSTDGSEAMDAMSDAMSAVEEGAATMDAMAGDAMDKAGETMAAGTGALESAEPEPAAGAGEDSGDGH